MYTDTFTKHWDSERGYTSEEAIWKKANVDDAYGVGRSDSKWMPAQIVPDISKPNGGYMITIRTFE